MRKITKVFIAVMMVMTAVGCAQKTQDFKYLIDEFADIKIMRYRIEGWDSLSFQQKQYVYHLAEAAKWGRDIIWDQHCKYALPVRYALENVLPPNSLVPAKMPPATTATAAIAATILTIF